MGLAGSTCRVHLKRSIQTPASLAALPCPFARCFSLSFPSGARAGPFQANVSLLCTSLHKVAGTEDTRSHSPRLAKGASRTGAKTQQERTSRLRACYRPNCVSSRRGDEWAASLRESGVHSGRSGERFGTVLQCDSERVAAVLGLRCVVGKREGEIARWFRNPRQTPHPVVLRGDQARCGF